MEGSAGLPPLAGGPIYGGAISGVRAPEQSLPKRPKPAQCNRDLVLARAQQGEATDGAQRLCQRCHSSGVVQRLCQRYTCVVCGGTYCVQCATGVMCRRRYVWVWYGSLQWKRSRRSYVWRRRDADVRWGRPGHWGVYGPWEPWFALKLGHVGMARPRSATRSRHLAVCLQRPCQTELDTVVRLTQGTCWEFKALGSDSLPLFEPARSGQPQIRA